MTKLPSDIALLDKTTLLELVVRLVDDNKHLRGLLLASEARIAELEHRLNKDSGNSSKPPSSDGFKKRKIEPAKPRSKGRCSGGQRGHKGHHLKRSVTTDCNIPQK